MNFSVSRYSSFVVDSGILSFLRLSYLCILHLVAIHCSDRSFPRIVPRPALNLSVSVLRFPEIFSAPNCIASIFFAERLAMIYLPYEATPFGQRPVLLAFQYPCIAIYVLVVSDTRLNLNY